MLKSAFKWDRTRSMNRRHQKTLAFMKASTGEPVHVLDLGAPNELSSLMQAEGYRVSNTDFDLDEAPERAAEHPADAVTAFEILEHLVSPLQVLRHVSAPRLFASIPLRLWFARAYRNPNDPWDRHYHEFEDWQFDWLLDKAGWEIIRREKWTSPTVNIGVRTLLRAVTPRYYIVEAVRKPRP